VIAIREGATRDTGAVERDALGAPTDITAASAASINTPTVASVHLVRRQ